MQKQLKPLIIEDLMQGGGKTFSPDRLQPQYRALNSPLAGSVVGFGAGAEVSDWFLWLIDAAVLRLHRFALSVADPRQRRRRINVMRRSTNRRWGLRGRGGEGRGRGRWNMRAE